MTITWPTCMSNTASLICLLDKWEAYFYAWSDGVYLPTTHHLCRLLGGICVQVYVSDCVHACVCICACVFMVCVCVGREVCTRCDNAVTFQGLCHLQYLIASKYGEIRPERSCHMQWWLPSVSLMLPDVMRPPRLFPSVFAYWRSCMKASETVFLLNTKQLNWRFISSKANHSSCSLGLSRSRRCPPPVTMVTVHLFVHSRVQLDGKWNSPCNGMLVADKEWNSDIHWMNSENIRVLWVTICGFMDERPFVYCCDIGADMSHEK